MVNYVLRIAADLENITDLQPHGGCDDPTMPYLFKVSTLFFFFSFFLSFVLIILRHAFASFVVV